MSARRILYAKDAGPCSEHVSATSDRSRVDARRILPRRTALSVLESKLHASNLRSQAMSRLRFSSYTLAWGPHRRARVHPSKLTPWAHNFFECRRSYHRI